MQLQVEHTYFSGQDLKWRSNAKVKSEQKLKQAVFCIGKTGSEGQGGLHVRTAIASPTNCIAIGQKQNRQIFCRLCSGLQISFVRIVMEGLSDQLSAKLDNS